MIVTIDGPAGAGKSTVTRLLAEHLGFQFLDTGAMYRAVTWHAVQQGLDLNDEAALQKVAQQIPLRFDGDLVFVGDRDVSTEIRTPEITRQVVKIADTVAVRAELVELQRRIANSGNFVCEGRDQGTVAFPEAFCKVYLTASSIARAERRSEQLQTSGHFVDFDQIVREQELRDEQDKSRPVGKLQRADDAIEVNTDHQSIEEVVTTLVDIVKKRLSESGD
jgi:cytidylate kinase